jgi:hypothetical protein
MRKKLRGGPRKLTPAMGDLVAHLLRGDDPFEAGKRLRFQRRAVRHLLQSPVFRATYDAARAGHERSPTLERLVRDTQPRCPETDPAARPAPAQPPGYVIRLPQRDPESTP